MVAKALLSDDQLAIEYTIHTCLMVAIVEYFLAALHKLWLLSGYNYRFSNLPDLYCSRLRDNGNPI